MPRKTGSPDALTLFISHSAHDAQIAKHLVALFQRSLRIPSQKIRCSSVDGFRLPVGVATDEAIRQEVFDATLFLAIVTPTGLRSSYVLFELGARWGAKRPLLPLLAAGTTPTDIPPPMKGVNALSLSERNQVLQLVEDVGSTISVRREPVAVYLGEVDVLVASANVSTAPFDQLSWEGVLRIETPSRWRAYRTVTVTAKTEPLLEIPFGSVPSADADVSSAVVPSSAGQLIEVTNPETQGTMHQLRLTTPVSVGQTRTVTVVTSVQFKGKPKTRYSWRSATPVQEASIRIVFSRKLPRDAGYRILDPSARSIEEGALRLGPAMRDLFKQFQDTVPGFTYLIWWTW